MGPSTRSLLLASLLCAGTPAFARAQHDASAITLVAPEGCPEATALQAEVASLVGRPIAEILLPEGLDPTISITTDGSRFVLSVTDAGVTRTLRDHACSALVRAAALIIALRVDADAATLAAATAAEPEPPAPELDPSPPPQPMAPSPTVPAPTGRGHHEYDAFEWSRRLATPYRSELPMVAIGVGGIVEAGIVPAISASVAADVVLRADRFEARVRGAYVFEQRQATSEGAASSAITLTGLACGRPFDVSFAIAFCGGVEGNALFARSYGVSTPAQTTAWTVAGVLGVWLPLIPWHGIDISLGAEIWARFYRPQFQVEGLGHVWDTDPYGGRFGLLVHLSP